MGTIEIREYRDADWERLCAIHDAARRIELKNAGLEEAFLPLVVAAGREDLFSYSLRVAQLNGVVAGFCAYSQEEIAWLYVAPESMRKGIGRALVQDALERIERRPVYLEVLVGNEPARKLYASCGFQEESIESGRMPGNEAFSVRVHAMARDF